jgi:hypothetical protein
VTSTLAALEPVLFLAVTLVVLTVATDPIALREIVFSIVTFVAGFFTAWWLYRNGHNG